MQTQPDYSEAGLWWHWVLGTTAAMGISMFALPIILAVPGGIPYIGISGAGIVGIVMMGLVALLQSLTLRRYLKNIYSWILAGIVGWIAFLLLSISGAYFFPFSNLGYDSYTLFAKGDLYTGAMLGLVIGLFQWLVLRGKVKDASWWIVINIVGFAVGLPLAAGIGLNAGSAFYANRFAQSGLSPYIPLSETGAVAGSIIGGITGFGLLWLLRHRISTGETSHVEKIS